MTTTWSVEPAVRGDGVWFVAENSEMVQVYAAPGVWLPEPAQPLVHETSVEAWRCACWASADDPVLDRDLPRATIAVLTREVCAAMPAALCAMVRDIMIRQLATAQLPGQCTAGLLVAEDDAHAGAAATAWILQEMRVAFPDEEWRLTASPVIPAAIPDTFDELLQRMPAPHVVVPVESERLPRTRELLRQLGPALLRSIVRRLDQYAARRVPHLYAAATRPDPEKPDTVAPSALAPMS
jgi:hypothetical protein